MGKTLANWHRSYKRNVGRRAENQVMPSLSCVQQRAATQTGNVWSDAMDKELDHQWAVRKDNFLQCLVDGNLLPQEWHADDWDLAQARLDHVRDLWSKRKREAEKKNRMTANKSRAAKALPVGAKVCTIV